MEQLIDLIGQKFGRLTVISQAQSDRFHHIRWNCVCDCGTQKIVLSSSLRYGKTKSCGCIQREKVTQRNSTHNLSKTYLYNVWCAMKSRCEKSNDHNYKYYGARGITVCDEWKHDFPTFQKWAYENGYKEEMLPSGVNRLTIDRINNDGDYEPLNCRWVTMAVQNKNKRNSKHKEVCNE